MQLQSNQDNSHLKIIISTNCCIHMVVPPDDGPRYAQNVYRLTKCTKNKLCIKLVFNLVFNFRHVSIVICSFLGNSPASEFNSRRFGTPYRFHLHRQVDEECQWHDVHETSAIKTQTPGNYPKRNILQFGFSLHDYIWKFLLLVDSSIHSFFVRCVHRIVTLSLWLAKHCKLYA